MGVIFDPRGFPTGRCRDTETGRYTKCPQFDIWCAEVAYRFANRKKAGDDYFTTIYCITVAFGDIPTEDDFLLTAQIDLGDDFLPFRVTDIVFSESANV